MLPANECPGVTSKGWHLYVPHTKPDGTVTEVCYFCGNPKEDE